MQRRFQPILHTSVKMAEFATITDSAKPSVFKLGGGREMVDAARASVLLGDIPKDFDPSIVCLSNKSISAEAAEIIGNRLKQLSEVEVADISDIIAGRHEDEALRTLKLISDSLAHFNPVEVNLSDNALGAKGIHSCKGLLVGKRLEVRLYKCGRIHRISFDMISIN